MWFVGFHLGTGLQDRFIVRFSLNLLFLLQSKEWLVTRKDSLLNTTKILLNREDLEQICFCLQYTFRRIVLIASFCMLLKMQSSGTSIASYEKCIQRIKSGGQCKTGCFYILLHSVFATIYKIIYTRKNTIKVKKKTSNK